MKSEETKISFWSLYLTIIHRYWGDKLFCIYPRDTRKKSIVNSKTKFIAWKTYMLIVCRNEYYLTCYIFFELQKAYLNRDEAGKNIESFETSGLNSTGTFSRSELA